MRKLNILLFFIFFVVIVKADETQKNFISVLNSVQKVEKKGQIAEMDMLNSDNYFDKHKNFINSSRDIIFLKKIVGAYKKNKNRASVINDSGYSDSDKNTTEDIYFNDYNYRTFIVYLKSIMFLSKNSWSIWLNDTKITNEDNNKNNEFYIKDIDDKKIILQWNISEFKWSYVNKMNSIPKQKYKTLDDGSVELILVLYSNQSYLPFADQIVEGKYIEKQEKQKKVDNLGNIDNEGINKEINNNNIDLEKIINSL